MKEIPLTLGRVCLVDDEDYDKVKDYSWRYIQNSKSTGYARTTMRINGVQVKVRMHRLLLNASADQIVDHADGDGLNNQRSNLRFATRSQNNWNRRQTKLKGVRQRTNGTWEARISHHKITTQIGTFSTDIFAALAYDRKARELFGEFACLNFHPDFESAYHDYRAMQD